MSNCMVMPGFRLINTITYFEIRQCKKYFVIGCVKPSDLYPSTLTFWTWWNFHTYFTTFQLTHWPTGGVVAILRYYFQTNTPWKIALYRLFAGFVSHWPTYREKLLWRHTHYCHYRGKGVIGKYRNWLIDVLCYHFLWVGVGDTEMCTTILPGYQQMCRWGVWIFMLWHIIWTFSLPF